jgi:ATP-dependent helicase/nuclease subunit B
MVWESLASLPALASVLESLCHFQDPQPTECLAPELARRLYGPILKSSVSRLEQFAACPFKFFVHSGLRAEERQLFELDVKEQGSFQHDVLALFHDQLHAERKRWRDITPAEARERIAAITQGLMASYRSGLLEASEQTRFLARCLTESLQDFVETLVGWMRQQYRFDPVRVELPFGEGAAAPPWIIDLGSGQQLHLYGRIDRIDLCRTTDEEALCVVVDYKSSQKQLDPLLLAHGLQLQLLTYLNVLRHWPDPRAPFGVARLVPAGVFYVNLHGMYDREPTRLDALADPEQARKRAYRHAGRFDARALPQLDARADAAEGDQFNYRLTIGGKIHKHSREALATPEFRALLDSVEVNLRNMGEQIYAGTAEVSPYRKGAATACDQCGYQAICRIDPWTHRYRVLRKKT